MQQAEDDANWAVLEFGDAQLGDKRRTTRLVSLAGKLAEHPEASLPEATGSRAMLKATYRLFANEDINTSDVLASHVQATYRRIAEVQEVLAIQDTTYLDWTHHPATKDVGPLGTCDQRGLVAHTTIAFTPDRVPLGILDQQVWARDAASYGQQTDHKKRPIEEKESRKWLDSLAAVKTARQHCPNTHLVSVGDREADVYELMAMERPEGVDLLVRAAWDRRVEHPEKYLWETVKTAPVAATSQVYIPRRGKQAARTANLDVHWRQITLCPPRKRPGKRMPHVTVGAVWAIEPEPPAGIEALEWLLLTTVPVCDAVQALERLEWYACRQGIEVWHKILKSGCRIESRQLEAADRLGRCLTVYSVIAWRILYATMLARAVPDMLCTALLDETEWQALYCAIHKTAAVPSTPPTLGQAVRWIAQLGGFLGRKRDGHPGPTVLWKGFRHLDDLATMYRILRPPGCRSTCG